jgi:membrane protein implicated in regulation of membrane protease activity
MSWTDFYLVCLIVGLALALMSLLLGAFHVDLPRHFGGLSFGGHTHLGPLGHGHAGPAQGAEVSPANFSTLMVFLAWFGGAGFLLAGVLRQRAWVALPGATLSGVLGAYFVYLFVARVLMAQDHAMLPHDYTLPGTFATVALAIREGGTGEIAYVQGGTRKSAAARSDGAGAISTGEEVVVTRFEEGIAYVRRFNQEPALGR